MSKRIAAALLAITSLAACSSQEQDQIGNHMGAPEAQSAIPSVKQALRMQFANCIKATVAPYNTEGVTVKHSGYPDMNGTSLTYSVPGLKGAEATAMISETAKGGIRVSVLNTHTNGVGIGEYADYERTDKNTVMVDYKIGSNPDYVKKHSKYWADFGKVGMLSNPAVQEGVQKCARNTFKVNFILKKG